MKHTPKQLKELVDKHHKQLKLWPTEEAIEEGKATPNIEEKDIQGEEILVVKSRFLEEE